MKQNAVLGAEVCPEMVKRGTLSCVLLAALATGVAAKAESLYPNIAYGDTVTISENHADTMVSVAGTLIVEGGSSATADNTTVNFGSPADEQGSPKTPAVIEVRKGTFGSASTSAKPTTMNLGADGGRGRMLVKGGTLGVSVLNISENVAPDDDGYVNYLRIEGGTVQMRSMRNNSSSTGRVVVAGASTFGAAHAWYPTMFGAGAFVVESESGAPIKLDFSNQRATLNKTGVDVRVRGACDVSLVISSNDSANYLNLNRGLVFENDGKISFSGNGVYCFYGSGVVGDAVTNLTLKANARLSFEANTTNVVKDITSASGANVSGSGTLLVDAAAADRSLGVDIRGSSLTVLKQGAHAATFTATTNFPHLVIREGAVRIAGQNSLVSDLSISEGAQLVADGVVVTILNGEMPESSLVVENGGKFIRQYGADSSLTELYKPTDIMTSVPFEKVGAGELRIYDPQQFSDDIHVKEGALTFSRAGLRDKYMHMVLKGQNQVRWPNTTLMFYDWWWYGVDSSPVPVDYYASLFSKQPADTAASELPAGGITYHQRVQGVDDFASQSSIGGASNIKCIFANKNGASSDNYNACTWTIKLSDPTNESEWLHIWVHFKDEFPDLDGYNFANEWNHGSPSDWTIETSRSGLDGTWRTVADVSGFTWSTDSKKDSNGFPNGTCAAPAFRLHYVESGVRGLPDSIALQVDEGALADFSAKESGQCVNKLTVDCAGAGVVSNVTFAATGELHIITTEGTGKVRSNMELPLVFGAVSGVENLESWTVWADGVQTNRKVAMKDGKLYVQPIGLMILFK